LVWRADRRRTLLIAAIGLLQSALPAATLWVSKLLLDAVAAAVAGGFASEGEAYLRLATLLAVQVALGAAGIVASALQSASTDLLGDSLQHEISARILRRAAQLDVERFEDSATYDRLQNAYREVGTRPLAVFTRLSTLVQSLLTLLSVSALMGQVGAWVVPLVLLASVPAVWVTHHFGTESYRMLRRRAADARTQNYLGRLLTSDDDVKEVRLFGLEGYLLGRWRATYLRFRRELVAIVRRRTAWGLAASLASALLVALATLSVLRRAAQGALSVGDFGLFVQGIVTLQRQFAALLQGVAGIQLDVAYMRNLFEFLEFPSRDLDAGETWVGAIERIDVENVSFRYPGAEREVLRDVSFRVTRGETLALVGVNGAGKTTLVKLLTRLYEPTGGRILLNGLDAARFSPRSVQREIATIFQDFGRYQMTVRENVAVGRGGGETPLDEVAAAARAAGAQEVVDGLPGGFDQQLGRHFEGGTQLSGGQWQRIALARLYHRGGSVLIFDEPTAALDAAAEAEAVERLRARSRERIGIVISHRFSTVRTADLIVVLSDGVVAEAGDHATLMARGGIYAASFALQARGYGVG
jgi:ATP-binding cassette, subfamily B, bacterial